MSVDNDTAFALVDTDLPWSGQAKVAAHWSKLDVDEGQISIPARVEQHAMGIRRDYLEWVHDLGSHEIQGKTIKSHLQLFPNLSLWWMTRIAEKEPLKSQAIYAVFKLRALENLYLESGCRGLVYFGNDLRLHQTLCGWCQKLGHAYEWRKPRIAMHDAGGAPISIKQSLKQWLPLPLRAFYFLLIQWLQRYRISQPRQSVEKVAPRFPKQATIFTYFPNVDTDKIQKGRFWSRYWEGLHELLEELPLTINWIWIYAGPGGFSFAETLTLRDRCNAAQPDKYRHWLIEEFVSPMILWNVVRNYLRLWWRARRLALAEESFHFSDSRLNFYPFMRADWLDSLLGGIAMENLVYVAMFDALTRKLNSQIWGLYVWENQPWEQALIAAWRRNQASRIIASQHSALRRMGLRSFSDARDYSDKSQNAPPLPDVLAVNGSAARALMLEAGYPKDRLALVEALRYLNLPRHAPGDSRSGDTKTLLVVAGYKSSEVEYQLRVVASAAKTGALRSFSRVWIKPHPFYPVESIVKQNGLAFRYEIIHAPLATLWAQTDAAFVANSTTAVVEAIYMHVPVAVCSAVNDMNLSPIFGFISVPMISGLQQLIRFLSTYPVVNDLPEDYFIWTNLSADGATC